MCRDRGLPLPGLLLLEASLPVRVRPSCGLHCSCCRFESGPRVVCIAFVAFEPGPRVVCTALPFSSAQSHAFACTGCMVAPNGASCRRWRFVPPPLPAACCCRHRHRRRRSSGPVRRHWRFFSRIAVAMRRCQCAHWHASQSQRADTALRFHPQKTQRTNTTRGRTTSKRQNSKQPRG